MELYHDKLFDKFSMYNSALLKKSCRLFKDTLLMSPHAIIDQTIKFSEDSLLPEYDELFRTFIENNQN